MDVTNPPPSVGAVKDPVLPHLGVVGPFQKGIPLGGRQILRCPFGS
jgi:hypothetical protein